jgi:LacI family transcriptional regulator
MRSRTKITLRTLAEATGLHPSTVSRILRGQHGRSSAATRARVVQAAERLGYQPDFAARSLRTRQSFALGFLVPDVRNIVFVSLFIGAEAAARRHGYQLLLSPVGNDQPPQKEHFDFLIERNVDGMLIATARLDDPLLEQLENAEIPYILVNRRAADNIPYVVCDDEEGGRMVTRHLIGLGHRRIGFVSGTRGVSTTEGRLAGYRAALTDASLPIDEQLIAGDGYTTTTGTAAARSLLNRPELPTAIVVSDDMMAVAVCRELTEQGLRVPEDVSVTGYNDLPIAALMSPSLTTIDNSLELMGEQAAELLVNRIHGQDRKKSLVISPQLVVRKSSVTPPLPSET